MPHLVAKALKHSHTFDNFSDVEPILTHFTRTCTYRGTTHARLVSNDLYHHRLTK